MSLLRFDTNQLFDPFFNEWRQQANQGLIINVDVKENKDAYSVHAEIPGIPKENIIVEHVGNLLKISGETKQKKEEKDERHHLRERKFGKFERQFILPKNANAEGIKAKHDNGILDITIPKKVIEQQKSNQIQIE